jgi:hypothetical protein
MTTIDYKEEYQRLRDQLNYRWKTNHPLALAAAKQDQRLYRKSEDGYVPVNDPYAEDGLCEGFWLIQIEDGNTVLRQEIAPDNAALHAAAILMEDKLISILEKACEAQPVKTTLSEEEKKDWELLIAKHGKSFSVLNYPSFEATAEEIISVLTNKK